MTSPKYIYDNSIMSKEIKKKQCKIKKKIYSL